VLRPSRLRSSYQPLAALPSVGWVCARRRGGFPTCRSLGCRGGCFNCYVVTGDTEGLVVVDPGMPTNADDLAPLLTAPLTSVTATHGHPDHISGAPLLASRHGVSIHVPATTLTYFDDTTPRTPSAAKLARTWPLLFGQPFDAKALIGFARGNVTAGFGTSRACCGADRGRHTHSRTALRLPAHQRIDGDQHPGPH
jgi:hypothetical protein